MAHITLKQLRYFNALARLGHFGRAADFCAISQPALSMQIKELETTLGAALFERGPQGLNLTVFGTDFAPRVQSILREVDALTDLAQMAQLGRLSRLRLGVIPTVAPYLLPRLIGQINAHHAELDLQLRETLTQNLITDVIEGRLDAAIVALPIPEPSLTEIALFTESFVLVRPLADRGRPVPSPESLREMRLLLLEEGHCFRDQALSFCNLSPLRPREIMDGSALTTLVQMVAAGIGVTLIPQMAVAVETASAPVITQHFAAPEPSRTIGMVWRRNSPMGAQLTQIADLVRHAGQTPA
jgi:LysR family transcriptional regulator, hydrogen peroxide-inducible genes activator